MSNDLGRYSITFAITGRITSTGRVAHTLPPYEYVSYEVDAEHLDDATEKAEFILNTCGFEGVPSEWDRLD